MNNKVTPNNSRLVDGFAFACGAKGRTLRQTLADVAGVLGCEVEDFNADDVTDIADSYIDGKDAVSK